MPNEKHAYLILCHNHFRQLGRIVELLRNLKRVFK